MVDLYKQFGPDAGRTLPSRTFSKDPACHQFSRPPPSRSRPVPESSKALITVVVLCFGGLSASLMQTLVLPIQGELPQLLHTSAANASWVITATLLAAAVAMPIAGRLGDMFGKQRVLRSAPPCCWSAR